MAFQPVLNTVEIDMIFTQNGRIVQNSFYAEKTTGYIQADLQALADQIDVQWQGTWRAQQPPEVVYLRTEVRGLAVPNDLTATQNANTNPGTHVGGAMPNNVTFSIKKVSGLTGRSARGRCYWVGVPASVITPADENLITAAYAAAVVASVDSIRAGILAVVPWLPVLVSRFADGAPRATGKTFTWLTTTNVDLQIDTQRGRMN